MAAVDSRLIDLSPEEISSPTPSPALTTGTNTPRHETSPSRDSNEAQRRRQQRHSKKLSINFPILLPVRAADTPESQYTASPVLLSTHPMMHNTTVSPPSTHASNSAVPSSTSAVMPLTPPSEGEDPAQISTRSRSKSKGHGRQESAGAEFLTLLASQERRVLELKEELSRAETELVAFKRQWALYEAGKKKNEVKGGPVKMEAVQKSHARAASVAEVGTGLGLSGIDEPLGDDKAEQEREKRRELARERMMGRMNSNETGQTANGGTKKNGQRVFSSSRHTRTLSLLATPSGAGSEHKASLEGEVNGGKTSLESLGRSTSDVVPSTTASISTPSISRTNSGLEGLNLGKTYKDLANAAARKNLPPGLSPEQFVKQGRQMVDGVRDGLWNFFEDIRQATVGDEAINGNGIRRQNSMKSQSTGNSRLKRTMTDSSDRSSTGSKEQHDSSFWKEFGMDTPKSDKIKQGKSNTNGTTTEKREKRPSLPGRWPSSKIGDEVSHTCPEHGHAQARGKKASKEEANDVSKAKPKPKTRSKRQGDNSAEHHESKSSTDSRNPPSLVSDVQDDEDGWDHWDSGNSSIDPNSPASQRKRSVKKAVKKENVVIETKAVQWHDLMS